MSKKEKSSEDSTKKMGFDSTTKLASLFGWTRTLGFSSHHVFGGFAAAVAVFFLAATFISCSENPGKRDLKRLNAANDRTGDSLSEDELIDYEANPLLLGDQTSVSWLRAEQFSRSIAASLDMAEESLCLELDQFQCLSQVFLGILGGNNPETSGIYNSVSEPTLLTSVGVERFARKACQNRVEKDQNVATKFFPVDLSEKSLSEEDAKKVVEFLFEKVLSRPASLQEVELFASLAEEKATSANGSSSAVSSEDFAAAVCIGLISSTEFLFY